MVPAGPKEKESETCQLRETDRALLKDEQAMDAYMSGLFQKYF